MNRTQQAQLQSKEKILEHKMRGSFVKITIFFPLFPKHHNSAEELTIGAEKRRTLTKDWRLELSAHPDAFHYSF